MKNILTWIPKFKNISATKPPATSGGFLDEEEGQTLGRLASKVALLLRNFSQTSHLMLIAVIMSLLSILQKNQFDRQQVEISLLSATRVIIGQRSLTATELFAKDPARLIEKSLKGMLPKISWGTCLQFRRCWCRTRHEAQQPEAIKRS